MNEPLPALPKKLPHFFTDIAWDILHEIDYDNVVYLSLLATEGKRAELFEPLVDSLRKAQRAQLAANEAITVDALCAQDYDPTTAFQDPVGQMKHIKALIEFVYHLKAALDSIAIFLNVYFSLGFAGGDRDFRKAHFKQSLKVAGQCLADFFNSESKWLELNSTSTDSIIATRDEWTHRNSPDVALTQPPGSSGIFPVPVDIRDKSPFTKNRSTHDFAKFHWNRYIKLFSLLLTTAIDKESARFASVPQRPEKAQNRVSAMKTTFTKQLTVSKMKLGRFTSSALDGNAQQPVP